MLIPLLLIFILGLFIGSFLNVLIDRLPKNEGVVRGRSYCDHCKKKLGFFDLIPLLSLLLLRGKCRYCSKKISLYYPLIELLTGILFVAAFYFLPSTPYPLLSIPYYLFIVSALVVVFFIDLKHGIISDKVVYPAIAVSVLYLFAVHNSLFLNHLLSALGAFLFFLILLLITRGKGMGWGDVKFAFLVGLILGFPGIIVGLYLAFLTGAVAGVILILWRKKKLRGTTIPFGPFLVAGTFLSLFYLDFFTNLLLGIF